MSTEPPPTADVWVVTLYENQRKNIAGTFKAKALLPTDRGRWTTLNGKKAPTKEDTPLPQGFEWAGPWALTLSSDTDSDGWQYAWNFTSSAKKYRNKSGRGMFVRRRQWTRTCRRVGHAAAPEDAAMVEEDSSVDAGSQGASPLPQDADAASVTSAHSAAAAMSSSTASVPDWLQSKATSMDLTHIPILYTTERSDVSLPRIQRMLKLEDVDSQRFNFTFASAFFRSWDAMWQRAPKEGDGGVSLGSSGCGAVTAADPISKGALFVIYDLSLPEDEVVLWSILTSIVLKRPECLQTNQETRLSSPITFSRFAIVVPGLDVDTIKCAGLNVEGELGSVIGGKVPSTLWKVHHLNEEEEEEVTTA